MTGLTETSAITIILGFGGIFVVGLLIGMALNEAKKSNREKVKP